jgi:UDP-GlcNAc3NAcA epimerase
VPDVVVVFGDTNSTLAGALAAVKLHIPVAHVEAGVRSFDRKMPEEINRLVVDQVSSWLYVSTENAVANLAREGVSGGAVIVGDVMIDAIRINAPRALAESRIVSRLGLTRGDYHVATIHRDFNSDASENLKAFFAAFRQLEKKVVFPVHPRTRANLERMQLVLPENVIVTEPLGYGDMLALVAGASVVFTDSGGLQKEAYFLEVPCVTLRDSTEWVETVEAGWNVLCGNRSDAIVEAARRFQVRPGSHPELFGDGHASERIVAHLEANVTRRMP